MEANTISLKTFTICLAAVIVIETGFRSAAGARIATSLPALGLVRCVESALLVTIVLAIEKKAAAIGLSRAGTFPALGNGLIWSALFGLAAGLLYLLLHAVGIDGLKYLQGVKLSSGQHLVGLFVVGGVIGPITEEIFFRGVVYGFFRKWGVLVALFLSTLLFVSIHSLGAGLPVTQLIGGLVFAIAYEKERNLMVPITIHCLGNLAIFSLSFLT